MDTQRSSCRRFVGLALVALSFVASAGNAQAGFIVNLKGENTSAVVAGTYMRGGETLTTSAVALKSNQDWAAQYDGATEFKADYTINFNKDNTVDSKTSTVTFITVNYTDNKKEVKSKFTTLPITITGVTLTNNDPTKIESFTFSSNDWYPKTEPLANALNNKGLSGSISLKTGAFMSTASYSNKSDGAVYTYTTKATIQAGQPFPSEQPDNFGDPEIFTPLPTPEPATWVMVTTGLFAGIAYRQLTRKRRCVPCS
jgi:hypothetical protein